MQAHTFFRWKATAISLWIVGVLFASTAALNLWLATQASAGQIEEPAIGDSGSLARSFLRGAAENAIIAALCVLGWYFMRRRTPLGFVIGAAAVSIGLLITVRRWIFWLNAATDTLPWLEPIFVWPFFIYSLGYAYRQSRISGA